MFTIRRASDRFHTKIDWLDSWHTFSFGEHYDEAHMGFGPLRVINDDIVAGGGGFPTHGHRDMEIITVVLSGSLQHKDSIGTGSVIRPGDVQKMSAGSGIHHSEFNASKSEPCHLLQIWIIPAQMRVLPAYQQIALGDKTRNRFCLAVSPDGAEGSISLYQDAKMFIADLDAGATLDYALAKGRMAWVHVAAGEVDVNGTKLDAGDGLAVSDEKALSFVSKQESKVLLFDMAA